MVARRPRLRSHTAGVTRIPGFLDDHAAVALGFLALYELTFDREWFELARAIWNAMCRWFRDAGTGEFFDTASDAEPLMTRPRDITDNAMPAGSSLAAELFLLLAELTGDPDSARRRLAGARIGRRADGAVRHDVRAPARRRGHGGERRRGSRARRRPARAGPSPARPRGRRALRALARAGRRRRRCGARSRAPEGRDRLDGHATAYVCRGYRCEAPARDAATLGAQLAARLAAATAPTRSPAPG